jgi:hypothetical protein
VVDEQAQDFGYMCILILIVVNINVLLCESK